MVAVATGNRISEGTKEMRRMATGALALLLVVTAGRGASAQEALPPDVIEIQSCIEGVREYNAGAEFDLDYFVFVYNGEKSPAFLHQALDGRSGK